MTFAEKLYALRKKRGMSQEELANAIGVSRQAVSKWESGQSLPETEKLIRVSELFEVSLDFLVKDAKEEPAAFHSAVKRGIWYPEGHYEYKSKRTVFGIPLVHINVGRHGVYTAKGIIAIGNIAIGVVSMGAVCLGAFCIGVLALGILSLAVLSCGLFSVGGIAVGAVAAGGVSVGVLALGGVAVGKYALGGCAVASDIAAGGFAKGHIAIGDAVQGTREIVLKQIGIHQSKEISQLIEQEFPGIWEPIKTIFTWVVS
ncbi:MAG: helix-turn-helix domain-containing protein [Oscillospiraceae bacterium]|jgi:transcriptional regulator with XRE-family HTH domain|nr:helix-turn-helix domain-containing protein [Oscillospiraceae bacterium]